MIDRSTQEANRYHVFARGWRDGAGSHAMRPDHMNHPTLAVDYEAGYASGRDAYSNAMTAASARLGYVPCVLRTQAECSES